MSGWRILVADDEPLVLEMIRDTLEALPASVLTARDGEEALRVAKTERPDLILLDVMMPKLDGFMVAEALKQDRSTAAIPLIFISALGGARDKVRGLDLGAEDYLAKPIDADDLRIRVRTILGRGRPPRAKPAQTQEPTLVPTLEPTLVPTVEPTKGPPREAVHAPTQVTELTPAPVQAPPPTLAQPIAQPPPQPPAKAPPQVRAEIPVEAPAKPAPPSSAKPPVTAPAEKPTPAPAKKPPQAAAYVADLVLSDILAEAGAEQPAQAVPQVPVQSAAKPPTQTPPQVRAESAVETPAQAAVKPAPPSPAKPPVTAPAEKPTPAPAQKPPQPRAEAPPLPPPQPSATAPAQKAAAEPPQEVAEEPLRKMVEELDRELAEESPVELCKEPVQEPVRTTGLLTSGQLQAMNLESLIQLLESERHTAKLLLTRGAERGEIAFVDGAISRAVQGSRQGEAAVYQFLTWREGTFHLEILEAPSETGSPVTKTNQALLMEGMRRLEEIPGLRAGLPDPTVPMEVPAELRAAVQKQAKADAAVLMALLDGTRTLEQVLAQSPFDAWTTMRDLNYLLGTRAIPPKHISPEIRTGPRVILELPIEHQRVPPFQEASSCNLSARGVFIQIATPYEIGEQVLLRFALPGKETPVKVLGRVVSRNTDPDQPGGVGMGIRFLDLPPADREIIERNLAEAIAAGLSRREGRRERA